MSEQRVIYLGRRLTTARKIAHLFGLESDPDITGLFDFRRGGPWVIGGIYDTEGETSLEGHINSLFPPHSWGGDRPEDPAQVAAWELLDRQAFQAHAARAAEARARRCPTYLEALTELAPIMDCARTRAEADQIAQTIRFALIDSWHSRRVAHGDRS